MPFLPIERCLRLLKNRRSIDAGVKVLVEEEFIKLREDKDVTVYVQSNDFIIARKPIEKKELFLLAT